MVNIKLTVHLPQLKSLGDKLVALLDSIHEALNQLDNTLVQELTEIAAALAGSGGQPVTPEEIAVVIERIDDMRVRVHDIIPDAPPEPEPDPEPVVDPEPAPEPEPEPSR